MYQVNQPYFSLIICVSCQLVKHEANWVAEADSRKSGVNRTPRSDGLIFGFMITFRESCALVVFVCLRTMKYVHMVGFFAFKILYPSFGYFEVALSFFYCNITTARKIYRFARLKWPCTALGDDWGAYCTLQTLRPGKPWKPWEWCIRGRSRLAAFDAWLSRSQSSLPLERCSVILCRGQGKYHSENIYSFCKEFPKKLYRKSRHLFFTCQGLRNLKRFFLL